MPNLVNHFSNAYWCWFDENMFPATDLGTLVIIIEIQSAFGEPGSLEYTLAPNP